MPSSPFLFSKHSNISFAFSFCILTFPLGGFIRNMNILLGGFCLFLFYILFPNNFVTNIFFPGKQGIYLENGIRPLFLFYKLGKFFLQVS